ncbi:lipopolysaccharide biosynthesis protein [Latilactobacillus curvatus]|uniref:lipopolysaccharide biosynthesis protein n=1 Tax=Latilactobacillus curvatus TaxID=28038 RepID=UPI002D78FED4|nr:polysaccharide biosynthesis C-terminal domain-containing protein [Latilactobacillus curvatus]WRS46841.1 polysaccharide biosynthesis C-terminal domain-containing protein [Latilactobacillus curvatus]
MNKYRKLIINSGIFTIANFGTKLLNIIFVPLYTYWLSTSQYGTVDLTTTTINLLAPLAMLGMSDAVMRFAFDRNVKRNELISSAFYVFVVISIILSITSAVIAFVIPAKAWILGKYLGIFLLILFSQNINSILAQYHRGIGNVKIFAINGILITLVQILMNVLTLAILKLGVFGYLWSLFVSYILPSMYLVIKDSLWKIIRLEFHNNTLIRSMLIYTLPLIPTNMMWWVMNLSSRYIIVGSLGVAANGIFAVSNKIPTIINLLNTIFQQAWQMSAIEEYNDSDQETGFISSVYEYFVLFMVLGTSGIMIFVYPIVAYTFSSDYFSSLKYIPFLLIAAMFSSFAGFLGTNYVATKNTIGALKTSFIGAIINVILTFILIKNFGLAGVAYAMMIAYFITWLYRIFDTKKLVGIGKLKINLKLSIFMLLINGILVSRIHTLLSMFISLLFLACMVLLNVSDIYKIFRSMKKIRG